MRASMKHLFSFRTIMAEGHAKLSLRHEVTVYDALAAIKLYEENMALHSGYSPILQYDAHLEASEVSQFHIFNSVTNYFFLQYYFCQQHLILNVVKYQFCLEFSKKQNWLITLSDTG